MASVDNPGKIPVISLVHGSQAPQRDVTPQSSGKSVPPSGNAAATNRSNDLQAQVAFLNKYLNDSGRPDQFRVAPDSDAGLIQEVNPASGAVIAEYPAISFPALARSLGVSRALIDDHA